MNSNFLSQLAKAKVYGKSKEDKVEKERLNSFSKDRCPTCDSRMSNRESEYAGICVTCYTDLHTNKSNNEESGHGFQ